ncbi:hypothetical protein ACGFX4_09470 [Kitasatospora sp. NPDC048365]
MTPLSSGLVVTSASAIGPAARCRKEWIGPPVGGPTTRMCGASP